MIDIHTTNMHSYTCVGIIPGRCPLPSKHPSPPPNVLGLVSVSAHVHVQGKHPPPLTRFWLSAHPLLQCNKGQHRAP